MADGDPAYSHVPSDAGAPLCESGGGAPLFRKTRLYWRLRFDFSFYSGYEGNEDYEDDAWIPPGMVRDGPGRYHLEWAILPSHGTEPPYDLSAADIDLWLTIDGNGNVTESYGPQAANTVRFYIVRGAGHSVDGVEVYVRAPGSSGVSTGTIPCTFPASGAFPAVVHGTDPGPRYGAENFEVSVTLSQLPHHPLCAHWPAP